MEIEVRSGKEAVRKKSQDKGGIKETAERTHQEEEDYYTKEKEDVFEIPVEKVVLE